MLAGAYDCADGEVAARLRRRLAPLNCVPAEAAAGPTMLLGSDRATVLSAADGVDCGLEGWVDNLDDLGREVGAEADDAGEILRRMWARWGEGMVERLRGSFALVVWERARRRGMVAVDQLGTRAVYYRSTGAGVVFASELADLLSLLPQRPEVDAAAMAHWLAFSDPPAGHTLYAGVRRLGPGLLLRLIDRRSQEVRYWPRSYVPISGRGWDEAVAGLRRMLERAVARHGRSSPDTAAVLLSGGLDSGTVAGVLAEGERSGLRAYSATFPTHPPADETAQIVELVGRLGLSWTTLAVAGGSATGGAVEFLEGTQLPPSSPNLFFWLPLLRRAAGDGMRVLIDGEGGDELFGASRYLAADRLRHGQAIAAGRLIMRLPGAGDRPPLRRVLEVAGECAIRAALPPRLRRGAARLGWAVPITPLWLNPTLQRLHRATLEPDAWIDDDQPRWRSWLLHALCLGTGGPQLAREHVRQRSALAGLDAHHPLLDVDLVEFMLGLDPELSFDPHLDRPLLRAAMRSTLPDSIRLRPAKSSFDAPFHHSLAREFPAIRALIGRPGCELRAYVNGQRVRRDVLDRPGNRFASGGHAWALTVWRLITAELWLALQHDATAPRRMLEQSGFPASTLEIVGAGTG